MAVLLSPMSAFALLPLPLAMAVLPSPSLATATLKSAVAIAVLLLPLYAKAALFSPDARALLWSPIAPAALNGPLAMAVEPLPLASQLAMPFCTRTAPFAATHRSVAAPAGATPTTKLAATSRATVATPTKRLVMLYPSLRWNLLLPQRVRP